MNRLVASRGQMDGVAIHRLLAAYYRHASKSDYLACWCYLVKHQLVEVEGLRHTTKGLLIKFPFEDCNQL